MRYPCVWCSPWIVLAALGCRHDSPFDPRYGRDGSIAWAAHAPASGRVTTDGTLVFFSGIENELIAVEKATGRSAWRTRTQNTSAQTVGFGTAVSGPVVAMTDIDVYAFDRNTDVPRCRLPSM